MSLRDHIRAKTKHEFGKLPCVRRLRLSIRLCAAGTATSNMLTGSHSPRSTASFTTGCGRCCAGRSTDRVKDDAYAITNNGRMPSSLTLGCSRCMRPIARRANPDVETTDSRARRARTAQRVRRAGTAVAVPYPYSTKSRPTKRRFARRRLPHCSFVILKSISSNQGIESI